MTKEEMLKCAILAEYKSLREFSIETNLPYSTLQNILRRGIDGAGTGNVMLVCRKLGIDVDALLDGTLKQSSQELAKTINVLNGDSLPEQILRAAEKLNQEGQQKVLEYVVLLRNSGDYLKRDAEKMA